jgi:hypothetical protein
MLNNIWKASKRRSAVTVRRAMRSKSLGPKEFDCGETRAVLDLDRMHHIILSFNLQPWCLTLHSSSFISRCHIYNLIRRTGWNADPDG